MGDQEHKPKDVCWKVDTAIGGHEHKCDRSGKHTEKTTVKLPGIFTFEKEWDRKIEPPKKNRISTQLYHRIAPSSKSVVLAPSRRTPRLRADSKPRVQARQTP